MRKLFLYFIVMAGFFSSCKKETDHVFSKSPDERLNEALAAYQTQLTGAVNGWKAIIYPAGGGAYGFYLKFNDSNRVKMYSDFDPTSSVTIKESSYRLKALQQPSLLFDTYSYIHVLADPDSRVNGGNLGQGLRSDFEFYFESSSDDTIHLVGRFNGSRATLIRATAEEEQGYNNGLLISGLAINNILTYFKNLSVGAQSFDLIINSNNRSITFNWKGTNGNRQTFTTVYYFIPGEIVLGEAFTTGNITVTGFKNIAWNNSTQILNVTTAGVTATITATISPLAIDTDAARAWWLYAQKDGSYYVSFNGFRVNGVEDGFNMRALTNFYFLLYWPSYGTGVDLLGFVFFEDNSPTLSYGIGYTPTFTNDGKLTLSFDGELGDIPDSDMPVITNISTRLLDPAGFYLVQTGATTYDMVSAADGKAWISWAY